MMPRQQLFDRTDNSEPLIDIQRSDKIEEACGVFGVYDSKSSFKAAQLTYLGLYALQHRGQESAGIASLDRGDIHCHKDTGLVPHIFNDLILEQLTGKIAIGHTRYSNTGLNLKEYAQPIVLDSRLGKLALAHNGKLVNTFELHQHLTQRKANFITSSDSEMLALAIVDEVEGGKDWIEAATSAFKLCEGTYSLTIATPNGLIGARDRNGIRPLVIGSLFSEDKDSQCYVLSSETCGLDIIGAEYVRDVQPGELVWISDSGIVSINWAERPKQKLCIFEMIYAARPDSMMHGNTLYNYRVRIGRQLAIESFVDADLVIGVPDSGIPAAIGFSRGSELTYGEGLIKNRYIGRNSIRPTESMQQAGIRTKLNTLDDALRGKRIILVDDSIVRGITSEKIVKTLRDAGAKEVHMRISSPPITHPCFYSIDTDNQDRLIAATKSVKEIEEKIGVDTLAYLSWEGMLQATLENPNHFCSACFTGDYPVTIPENVKSYKLISDK